MFGNFPSSFDANKTPFCAGKGSMTPSKINDHLALGVPMAIDSDLCPT